MKPRTRARGIALQVLYEIDIVGHPMSRVLQTSLDEAALEPTLSDFAGQIVTGVRQLIETLDSFIAQHAPEWPLNQVATIDRNILRIALWELSVYRQTPILQTLKE